MMRPDTAVTMLGEIHSQRVVREHPLQRIGQLFRRVGGDQQSASGGFKDSYAAGTAVRTLEECEIDSQPGRLILKSDRRESAR